MCFLQKHLHEIGLQSSIFAFVRKRHKCICKHATKKVIKVCSWKKLQERIVQGLLNALVWKTKYNFSLKQSCLERYTTPKNTQWKLIRLLSFNDLEMCLHVLYTVCTHGMPISNRLFWMSCLPSMVMQSWMHNSIRQPAWAHCRERLQSVTVELTGYKFSNALVIRTEVTRTICQVIFHMMMHIQDSKNRGLEHILLIHTHTCKP